MKIAIWIVAAVAIACALPAQAATSDPLNVIYAVTGVFNNPQTSTLVHCANSNSVPENFQVLIRDSLGGIPAVNPNNTVTVAGGGMVTFGTQPVTSFVTTRSVFTTATTFQGTIAILSTTRFAYCTAMIVGVGSSLPDGIALHLIRFNPWPGADE